MHPWKQELRSLTSLAAPITASYLGMMAMNIIDVWMVGNFVGGEAFAAVGLGNSYGFMITHLGLGLLMVLDPVVAQAVGARDEAGVRRGLQRGLVLAILISIPIGVLWMLIEPALQLFQQPAALIPTARDYVQAMVPSLLPFYCFFALRLSLQAMHHVRAILLSIVVANCANVVLDWILIRGAFGLPAYGAVGCGWATTVCRWIMLLSVLGFGWSELGPHLRCSWRKALRVGPLLRMLRLGTPLGLQNFIEAAAFASIAYQMGWIGTGEAELGGHYLTLQYASFAFMLPVGIANATAIRVGNGIGARDHAAVRRSALVSLTAGALVMLVSGILFLTLPGPLARWFSTDPDIVRIAIALLPIAGVFQIFDGIQVVAGGVLRGIGDVRSPMLIHAAGFWLFGLPLGWLFTFRLDLGPQGLWWGLVIGLGSVAIIFLVRITLRLRTEIDPVQIDRGQDNS